VAIPKVIALDFETRGIQARPEYPPYPVGCAIYKDSKAKYLAWDHPVQNNISFRDAKKILKEIVKNNEVVFHNAAFDVAVGVKHMGWKNLNWRKIHDTLFLAFLFDPRSETLSLKPWCEKYLNMPPEEQDKLKEWILKNVVGAHELKGKNVKHPELYWAANIDKAPANLVGKYAKGDVIRTNKMFRYLWPRVIDEYSMLEAYDRERGNLLIFDDMSKQGININRKRLGRDITTFKNQFTETEILIHKKLGCTFNISSGKELADALTKSKAMSRWVYTDPTNRFPKGQKSTARKNLVAGLKDKKLAELLTKHGLLKTYLGTFMEPWYKKSKVDNRIYPTFNQVRSTGEFIAGSKGTRTGRPSSSNPNLLNVPKNIADTTMPWMRRYLIPDEGCYFLNRDYSQQEVRLLAWFENDVLFNTYLDNPKMDAHTATQQLIKQSTGVEYPRKFIKGIVFGLLYGMGLKLLSETLKIDIELAQEIKQAYFNVYPSVKDLIAEVTTLAAQGEYVQTWGGRVYFKEEHPQFDLSYKMINYLIQGSAADVTKTAMINVNDNCKDSRLTLQVYDEILINSPKGSYKKEMQRMKEAMEDIKIDLPMLSDGKIGRRSFGELKDYEN
jgi:DNA polymerase-1